MRILTENRVKGNSPLTHFEFERVQSYIYSLVNDRLNIVDAT
jgi:hypothetical protein